MKRVLAILTVLVLTLCFFSGCASGAGNNEEGATVGDLVDGSAQENADDSANGPQKVENTKDPSDSGDANGGNANNGNTNSGNTNNGNTNNGNTNSGNTDNGNTNSGNTDSGNTDNGNAENEPTDKGETNTGDADFDDEPAAIDPEAEGSGYFKILSYNLRGLRFGPTVNGMSTDVVRKYDVAAAIREIDADFVGLQELELNRARSGNFDHVPWLAKECGYEYYHFTQTVFDGSGDSGEGHGILSKYPIKEVKDVWYDNQDGEKRKYCRAVLEVEVDGKKQDVVFYNTHLCTDNPSDVNSVSAQQFKQVLRAFYNEKVPTFLTADFNIVKETRAMIVDYNKGVIGLDGGPDRCFFNDQLHIDDIYVRNVAEVYTNPDDEMAIFTGENMMGTVELTDLRPSDHIPCWGYVKLK